MSDLDVTPFAEVKSDQLTADDLIGGPRTITITRVIGDEDMRKVSIFYHGDHGKPLIPCKTVIRILMAAWGKYAQQWVGKSMTVYRDPEVVFSGLKVGGVRVSHMSDLDGALKILLTKTKGKKAEIVIRPLAIERPAPTEAPDARQRAEKWTKEIVALFDAVTTGDEHTAAQVKAGKALGKLTTEHPDLAALVTAADTNAVARIAAEASEEGF